MAKSKHPRRTAEDPPAPPLELGFSAADFGLRLNVWYREHARSLPWRGATDPYAIWLSEIMLQQTRVATVLDRYTAFLYRFPTIRDLAAADESDVLSLWSGLGYYRRARMLLRGAQFVEREFGGHLPQTAIELRALPGVGEYTAAAIASIAFRQPVAALDGNVERVLLRLRGEPEIKSPQLHGRLLHIAQMLMPSPQPDAVATEPASNPAGDHNQAMMELGATVCLPRSPRCAECPVFDLCKTRGEHRTPRRARMLSQNIAHLLAIRKHGVDTEVLLERRSDDAALMPGMLEIPSLPIAAAASREPVLRLRHSITMTNYYAQIFTESVLLDPTGEDASVEADNAPAPRTTLPFAVPEQSLLHHLAAPTEALAWVPTYKLPQLPLTGLTRKALQRLRLMALPAIRVAGGD